MGRDDDERRARESWVAAQRYASHLAHGGTPARVFVPGLVLAGDEEAAFEIQADHARFYGDDGTYTRTSGMFLGSWQFMAAGFAATAVANSVRRRRAEARSIPWWRDVAPARVVATDRRLLVSTPLRGMQSFWYEGLQEFYPEPRQWGMVMAWESAPPLRLTGHSVPYLSVHVAAHVMPGRWVQHPALAELVRGPVDAP